MSRWIVAGALLAVLIALIVVDTSSMEASVPSGAAGASVAPGAPPAPEAAAAAAGAQLPPGTPAATDTPELPQKYDTRPKLDASCGKVKDDIRTAKGDAFLVALGDRILERTTEDKFAAVCAEVADLPVETKIAKLEALAAGPAAEAP